MQLSLSRQAVNCAVTAVPLTEEDKSILASLAPVTGEWVAIDTVVKLSNFVSKMDLLSWLRLHSSNPIKEIGPKKLALFPVIDAWLHDPSKETVYVAISSYLTEPHL